MKNLFKLFLLVGALTCSLFALSAELITEERQTIVFQEDESFEQVSVNTIDCVTDQVLTLNEVEVEISYGNMVTLDRLYFIWKTLKVNSKEDNGLNVEIIKLPNRANIVNSSNFNNFEIRIRSPDNKG
jgi:hypothetical protein